MMSVIGALKNHAPIDLIR